MSEQKMVSIVCPVFDEEKNIHNFVLSIKSVFDRIPYQYQIIFIDDGSTDNTLTILKNIHNIDSNTYYLSFSRNFGKDAAITAGLDVAEGDAVIPMDVDLQDPPDIIPEMIEMWLSGKDVVLAKRISRSQDSFFKRKSAQLYYFLMSKVGDDYLHENVGDFRLLSRQVVDSTLKLEERTRYMQGLLSWVGYDVGIVEFERPVRVVGESKFGYRQLFRHALNGLTSFSVIPLRLWIFLGSIFSIFSMVYGVFIIIDAIVNGNDTPGYTSLFTAIVFFGGIQLISIGVIGEYIGRIYIETKKRPLYLIKEKKWKNMSTKK